MKRDPITGPITKEKLAELAAAPFGAARKEIRKLDPFYGREEGEKIEFEVGVCCTINGTAIIMARSQKEADELADDPANFRDDIDYDYDSEDVEVLWVKPYVAKP